MINDTDDISYDVIGKDVCMGDHKPVFLKCQIRVKNRLFRPRVESPSYMDLLTSPATNSSTNSNSAGGCFMEIQDPAATVKLFKETTV